MQERWTVRRFVRDEGLSSVSTPVSVKAGFESTAPVEVGFESTAPVEVGFESTGI